MVSKTAVGWILDVSKVCEHIIIFIKLEDGRIVSLKQRLPSDRGWRDFIEKLPSEEDEAVFIA